MHGKRKRTGKHLDIPLLEDTYHVPYKYKVTTLSLNCTSWVGVNVTFMTCVVWDTRSNCIIIPEVYICLTVLNFVWLGDLITISIKILVFVYKCTRCHLPEDGNIHNLKFISRHSPAVCSISEAVLPTGDVLPQSRPSGRAQASRSQKARERNSDRICLDRYYPRRK
jgi:hypothetical protein